MVTMMTMVTKILSARGKFPSEEQPGETLTLLLAEDRTEVDDEEYFQTLGDHGGDGDDCDVGDRDGIYMT